MKHSNYFPLAIDSDYTLHELSVDDFMTLFTERQEQYFSSSIVVDGTSHLSADEIKHVRLRAEAYPKAWRFQWALLYCGEAVGWTYAYQSDHETLYMCNTAIDPAHRGKGLYARIVQEVIGVARAEGFQLITSKHHASNSAVLVPKLKAGFIITGLTLDEKYGLMVLLTYFVDPVRRSLAVRRIGQAE